MNASLNVLPNFNCLWAVMAHTVSAEARVQSQAGPRGTAGGQIGTETGFFSVHWLSPLCVIPPMLHTQSCVCHQCSIILTFEGIIK